MPEIQRSKTKEPPTVIYTVRLPSELSDKVRGLAYLRRRTQSRIIVQYLTDAISRDKRAAKELETVPRPLPRIEE